MVEVLIFWLHLTAWMVDLILHLLKYILLALMMIYFKIHSMNWVSEQIHNSTYKREHNILPPRASIKKSIIISELRGIDIVVNNASAIYITDTENTSMKRYDLMHEINGRGTFLVSKEFDFNECNDPWRYMFYLLETILLKLLNWMKILFEFIYKILLFDT